MFKKTTFLLLSIFVFNMVFANSVSLKESLEQNYNNFITSSESIYNIINTKIQIEKVKISTWDYRILGLLTWISITNLEEINKSIYQDLTKKMTLWKYNILSEIEILDNSLKNNFITTWNYENELKDKESLISWYNIETIKDIDVYQSKIFDLINAYTWDVETKKEQLINEINIYKNFEKKLKEINNLYLNLEEKNTKLEDIIWVWKELLDKKSQDIKNYINNYFSWYVQKQYENLLNSDKNFTYFTNDFYNKKEIILWFINNKFDDIISSITSKYYSDINMQSLKSKLDVINNLSAKDVITNNSNIENDIEQVNNTIQDYIDKISSQLTKFSDSIDKNNVFEVLKQDIVDGTKQALSTIENDFTNTFNNWKDFIKNKKNKEQTIISQILVDYNEAIISWDIQKLKDFNSTLNNYKKVLVLPINLEIIEKYITDIEKKIEDLKYQNSMSWINNIEKEIKNFIIQENNTEKIKEIEDTLKNYENYDELKERIKNIKLQLKLHENLNKLYKIWAIRYYYQYGDLSDNVSDILKKYYDQFQQKGKKDIFEKKIKDALEKLDTLVLSLSNDKRAYYIIIIYNGLLKFKNKNL